MSHSRENYHSRSAGYASFTVNDCLISKSLRDENHADMKVDEEDDEAGSFSVQGESAMRLRCGGMTSKRSAAREVMSERQHNERHSKYDYGYRRSASTNISCD